MPAPIPPDKPLPKFKRRYVIGALGGLSAGAFMAINSPSVVALAYQVLYHGINDLPTVNHADTQCLLVLSPHPDDETLASGGLIQQVLAKGGEAHIVWMTSGAGFELDVVLVEGTVHPKGEAALKLGHRRMEEARKAAQILGVPAQNLYFLGYPDRGLLSVLSTEHRTTPFRSPYTEVNQVPFEGTLSLGAAYTGPNFEADFARVLDKVKPTLVVGPSPRDTHPDHKGTAELAKRVLGQRGELDKLSYWIVHGGLEWPLPKGLHRSLPLAPAPDGKTLPWERLRVSPTENEKKLAALQAHQTQMELLSHFMLAFVRTNELYSKQPL